MTQTKNETMQKKEVTPEYAKQLLDHNNFNRNLSDRWVDYYAQQMRDGQWLLTGDSIKIANDGSILDGQHRLHGVVKSGVSIWCYVIEGLDRNTFQVIDTGKVRSSGDVLHIAGYKNANNISAIVRMIILMNRGKFSAAIHTASVSNTDIINFIEQHAELHDDINFALHVYRDFGIGAQPRIVGALFYLFKEKNEQDAVAFMTQYSTGINLTKNNPVRLLRERLIIDRQNKTRLNTRDRVCLFIVAWNAFRQKKELPRLSVPANSVIPKIV